jgi:DNA polymerase bacteriophage-type
MTAPVELSIDFETASTADLKRVGAKAYSLDPNTQVLCMAYSFDGGQTVAIWRIGTPFPQHVLDHVANAGLVRAWNASFEWHIWNNTLLHQISALAGGNVLMLSQLRDTMAEAAYWGLPLSLDQAGPAAGIPITKDKAGHALMMRMCKPRAHDVTGHPIWWHKTDPQKFDQLCDYCKQDVRVEAAIAKTLHPVPQQERDLWALDQRINNRGVGLDVDLIHKLKVLAEEAAKRANQQLYWLTKGLVKTVTSAGAMLSYLRAHGYPYADLKRETVEKRLDEPDCGVHEREILELRNDVAKTSAAKLNSMLAAARHDAHTGADTVFGMLQYYGASRTGRWAGRLIQMQNMPRGVIKNVPAAIAMIKAGADIDQIEALFGPAMGVVSSCLRGCIVARPKKTLVAADFAQIEARVNPWLAGQQDLLDVFASGQDVYVYTANKNGSDSRQLGKVLVLACGFGMSGPKFQSTAEGYGLHLTEQQAKDAVKEWRANNAKIVQFWWDCDTAAKHVINHPSQHVDLSGGKIRFGMLGPHMVIRLPSGRHLVYRDARIELDDNGREQITYMGVDQYTRKWTRLKTYGGKLVENIVQAVARDLMADAMTRASNNILDADTILTVHDELIMETNTLNGNNVLGDIRVIMTSPPAWATGCPMGVDGWMGPRYKK